MRILFITPYAPNLVRVRPYNLIHALKERGHHVSVATLWETGAERNDLAALEAAGLRVLAEPLHRRRILWNSLTALLTGLPIQARYCWQPVLARALRAELERTPYDVIHIEHLRGAGYGLWLTSQPATHYPLPPIIWDSVDCISHLFAQAATYSRSLKGRLITRLELGRTRCYEGRLARTFDHITITSPVDKMALVELARRTKKNSAERKKDEFGQNLDLDVNITVLPNGVNLDYFTWPAFSDREPATLVFSGKMSYHANITMVLHLVRDIMPKIWSQRPNIKLWIVGKDPPLSVLSLKSHPNITVTGMVQDIRPYLHTATIAVVPLLYGAGSQFKVLEAMACGTPVVATRAAISALSVQPGRDLMVADSPDAFADMVLALLDEPGRQAELGWAGRKFVESHHDWCRIAARLEDIYRHAIGHRDRPEQAI